MFCRRCISWIMVFGLTAALSYAEPVRIPDWAVRLGEGEYLGVSLPGGGQRQAEVMALMSMCQQQMLFRGDNAVFEDSVTYDVIDVELLASGETVVLISSGGSRADYVKLSIKHPFYTFPTYETSQFEAEMQVNGECGMFVLATHSTKSGNNIGVMWQSAFSPGRMMWRRLSDGDLQYVGYSAAGYEPYAAVPADLSGDFDFSLDMEADNLYFSECMLVSKAMERGLFSLSAVSFTDDRLTMYSRIPPFSVWAKGAVEREVGIWQKKGKYEKSEDYVRRVNNVARQQLVDSLVAEGRAWYLRGAYSGMEARQSIVDYDADNEVFLISDSRFGDVLLRVPIDAAPGFEEQFSQIEKSGEYDIIGDTLALVGMIYRMDDGTTYSYSNTDALQYADVAVDYDFAPIEISTESAGKPLENRQLITSRSLSVGKSDVDTDIPLTGRKSENTFAVIIANENYDTESRVNYAINDGNTFRQYCIRTLGIPETNISLVQDATLNNIRAQVDMLTNIGKAYGGEARLIFYYAGHGIPDESSKDAYLLPVDGYGNNVATGYKLSELYSQLSAIPASSVLVFMDACFSGADRDDQMLTAARGIALRVKSEAPQGKMVVFSAAQGDQTAMGYDEKGHGMFTYYLLKKLQESRGEVTLGELGDYVTDAVRKLSSTPAYNKPQVPKVSVGESFEGSWRDIELLSD